MDFKIKVLETKKLKIKQPPGVKANIIQKHPHAAVFQGKKGSGKTMLLGNLLTRGEFYGDYFDQIFLFAGSCDDIFDLIGIPDENIFRDDTQWNDELQKILDDCLTDVKTNGNDKAKKTLVIFEDVIAHGKFMRRSKQFGECFTNHRHYGISTWITSQSYTRVPRYCRLQADVIFYFKGTHSERQLILDEYEPSCITKKQFEALVNYAVSEDYAFLTLMSSKHERERFRKNLDTILTLNC